MKFEIEFYLNDKGEVSPGILWDALKAVIRGRIIAISATLKKQNNQRRIYLENKVRELQKKHFSRQEFDKLKIIEREKFKERD